MKTTLLILWFLALFSSSGWAQTSVKKKTAVSKSIKPIYITDATWREATNEVHKVTIEIGELNDKKIKQSEKITLREQAYGFKSAEGDRQALKDIEAKVSEAKKRLAAAELKKREIQERLDVVRPK